MTWREFIRFAYGLMMGTSTPFLKPKKRYLFPVHREEIDSKFGLFLGGSCICGFVRDGDDTLVINVNQGAAASNFRAWIDERAVRGSETIVLNSLAPDFSKGLSLYHEAKRILVAGPVDRASHEGWGAFASRIEIVREETVIDIGEERVRLIPMGSAATGSDLAVFLERRSCLFTGALFNNQIHPILRPEMKPREWISKLEKLVERLQPRTIVPAEGDLARLDDVRLFISYLQALMDPSVEFSTCREKYDWLEIPSTTSLEENFDLLRQKAISKGL